MASGESAGATATDLIPATSSASAVITAAESEWGSVITSSGRVSAARMYQPAKPEVPFTPAQLARLDEALTLGSRETGLNLSVYLGELGDAPRATAERLHASVDNAEHSVLIAVSPGERIVEVITGSAARQRLADRGAKLAVMSMTASFSNGDLVGGLVNGLRMMADQAGSAPS